MYQVTKGFVTEISKNGYVKLQDCRRWLKVAQTLPNVEEHGGSKRKISREIMIKGTSAKIGEKVKIHAGRSKQLVGIVCEISKKGTMMLRNYGKWSRVIGLFKCNDTKGGLRGKDSEKK